MGPGNSRFKATAEGAPLTNGQSMEDRRLEHRRSKRPQTYPPARILIQDSTVHHCPVHNFTSSGVCIELTFEAEQLPDRFEFSFDNFRTVHVCKTIWGVDFVAGVLFETQPP